MREPSTQALEAARALLLRELPAPAERSDLAHVAQRVMLQLGKVMVQWIGAAGFAALLRRSLHEAGIGHPLLQTLRLDAGQIVHAAAAPSPPDAAAEREALVAFLATFIGLLGRVAGDAMALSLTEQAFAGAQEASVKSLAASRPPRSPIRIMMFTKGIDEMSLTHVPPRAPLRQPPMDGKAELPLLRTGVPGLDDVLGGGLPALSFNLIVGQSGSGKTTMAMQMLFANATLDAPGLFITLLGEPPLKLLRYQQRFAFFDVEAMGKTVRFLDLSEDVQSGDLEKVQQRIAQEVERVRPGLVVIDSFRGLVRSIAARDTDIAFEEFVQRLALHMTAWEVTSVLVGEHADSALRNNPVFTVADGIFSLLQDVDRNSMVRKLQVIKMRGMSAMPGLHTMRISETGVQVYPRMPSNAADVHVWSNARASTGMQALDEMMAGGIPRGDAVIIAGPAGTGKTTFVTQFVADGLRHDESCVILIFEERPETYLARARTRDVDFGAAIDAGKLRLIYVRPLDLSVDETFDEVSKAVQEIQASRVVIDSISGFELALAPTFRQDFRESLYRLVNGITGLGVTIVMTVEVIGGEIGLQFTNYGVSFLTDDIIVQRYVEIEGQLRKVLMIVKMRGSWHSRDFRIYDITADGVAIGARLREYNDIISGVPRLQSRIRLPVYAGLTDREVLVLEAIIRAPGVDAPRLATMMQLPGDALAAALERLTELGWVLMTQGEGGAHYHGLARELDA